MAKKFTKFLLFTASTAAILAGAYYYFQKKEEASNFDIEDFDDFDDFDDDLEDEVKSKTEPSLSPEERSYVSLDLDDNVEVVEEFFDDEEVTKLEL